MDVARAPPDLDRADSGVGGRDAHRHERDQQAECGTAEEPLRRGGGELAREPHARLDDQAASREGAAGWRAGGHVREVQVMDVQRGPGNLPHVGHQGDQGKPQLRGGTGAPGKLGQGRVGEEGNISPCEGLSASGGGSRSEGDHHAATDECGSQLGQLVCGGLGIHEPTGKECTISQERCSSDGPCTDGGDGLGASRGGTERAAAIGDRDGIDPPEIPAIKGDFKVKAAGKGAHRRQETEYEETIGLGTAAVTEVLVYKDTIGLGKSEKGDVTEYNKTVGLGKLESDITLEDEVVNPGGLRKWIDFWSSADEGSGDMRSPLQKARDGQRRRKMNSSTRRKLQHMGGQLCQVLLACAAAVGSLAEEVGPRGAGSRSLDMFCVQLAPDNTLICKVFGALCRRGGNFQSLCAPPTWSPTSQRHQIWGRSS